MLRFWTPKVPPPLSDFDAAAIQSFSPGSIGPLQVSSKSDWICPSTLASRPLVWKIGLIFSRIGPICPLVSTSLARKVTMLVGFLSAGLKSSTASRSVFPLLTVRGLADASRPS